MFNTMLVAGDNVTDSIMKFGDILRRIYKKNDGFRKSDFTINYLGLVTSL